LIQRELLLHHGNVAYLADVSVGRVGLADSRRCFSLHKGEHRHQMRVANDSKANPPGLQTLLNSARGSDFGKPVALGCTGLRERGITEQIARSIL